MLFPPSKTPSTPFKRPAYFDPLSELPGNREMSRKGDISPFRQEAKVAKETPFRARPKSPLMNLVRDQ